MRPRPRRRRLRWAVAMVVLCALATLPIGIRRCQTTQRSEEARAVLGTLVARLETLAAAGAAWPTAAAGPTPPAGACCQAASRKCAPDPTQWDHATWKALAMTLDDPHRYVFAYEPTPSGAALRAIGDLDCDGTLATFTAELTRVGNTVTVRWSSQQPSE